MPFFVRWKPDFHMVCVWLCVVATSGPSLVFSDEKSDQQSTELTAVELVLDNQLATRIERLWQVTWSRFYSPRTHLVYDYLSSYESGRELNHLPTAAEVQNQDPNECGYGTGMEDCMISAGVMLSLIVDRHAVTQEEWLRERAKQVFKGVQLCATAHGVPGFLARGVCDEDLKSVYPNSSRDQYTHAIHGLWHYFHSPLCDPATRQEIRQLMSAVADRMRAKVIAANDYDSLRLDGTRDTRGISRMWNVAGHEAARLPMIYAATWDVTGDRKYYDWYQEYVKPAIEQSCTVEENQPTYAFLQMQASLEVLLRLEKEGSLGPKITLTMKTITLRMAKRAESAGNRGESLDLTKLCTDWRSTAGLSAEGSYRPVWYCIRESGEAALAQLIDQSSRFPRPQQTALRDAVMRVDPDRVSSNGIIYLQAAYWKALRRQNESP
ncbi:hypothetical protein [Neorhodopirellula pilleata]|uniref:Glycosyl hydrolase family 76 n=1 Tax=Neorhodopirellula pilleata TaxID=2714738 RepID=A0A5C6AGE8_9BACT|nr:hypothetical protein [Neorhodopirellula pilleata]TWT99044.1 hypothetical protein Pla100_22180 [Neorhodopirellula pilleata]